MFGKKKKSKKHKKGEVQEPQVDLQGTEIHSIPEKFYLPKIKAGGGKTKSIGILIMVVAVIAAIAFAYYLYRTSFPATPEKPAQPAVATPRTNVDSNKKSDVKKEVKKDADETLNKKETTKQDTIPKEDPTESDDAKVDNDLDKDVNVDSNTNVAPPIRPKILPLGLDKDHDQLTDVEEALYGTDPNKPDSDQDSYLDAHEMRNGYSPLATGETLAESTLFLTHSSTDQAYSLVFPATWATEIDEEGLVMFKSASGEFISIGIYENPEELTLENWYLDLSPGVTASQVEEITVGDLVAVKSLDKLTIYLGNQKTIYVINYNVGSKNTLDYKTTFEVMYNSFRLSP